MAPQGHAGVRHAEEEEGGGGGQHRLPVRDPRRQLEAREGEARGGEKGGGHPEREPALGRAGVKGGPGAGLPPGRTGGGPEDAAQAERITPAVPAVPTVSAVPVVAAAPVLALDAEPEELEKLGKRPRFVARLAQPPAEVTPAQPPRRREDDGERGKGGRAKLGKHLLLQQLEGLRKEQERIFDAIAKLHRKKFLAQQQRTTFRPFAAGAADDDETSTASTTTTTPRPSRH